MRPNPAGHTPSAHRLPGVPSCEPRYVRIRDTFDTGDCLSASSLLTAMCGCGSASNVATTRATSSAATGEVLPSPNGSVFEHEGPIPFHHRKKSAIRICWQVYQNFPGQHYLAFNREFDQNFLLVAATSALLFARLSGAG